MAKKSADKLDKETDAFLLGMRVASGVRDGLEKGFITVNKRGHTVGPNPNFNDPDQVIKRWKQIFAHIWDLAWTSEQAEAIPAIADNPDAEPWPEWLPFGKKFECRECFQCAQEIEWETNGREIRTTCDCPYPDGYPDMVMELNVPSGKMVVANDLRQEFGMIGDYDIGTNVGIAATVKGYGLVGLAHSFVGNTCPGVWRCTEEADRFALGCEEYDEETDEPIPINETWEEVAGVCTDLWWYSIADYDEYIRRRGGESSESVVDCKPGVYRFTNRYHRVAAEGWNRHGVFTDIEWIREPDPIRDYRAEFEAQNRTAGQVIADDLKRHRSYLLGCADREWAFSRGGMDILATAPPAPPEERHTLAVKSAAGQILVGNGGGRDWHPNGWTSGNPELAADAPSVEIPVFDQEYHWSPISEGSLICLLAGVGKCSWHDASGITLNESFSELAFNILQCIIRHGTKEYITSSEPEWELYRKLESEYWAAKAFDGLAKRWPDRVPEYCHDLIGCGKKAKMPKRPKPAKKKKVKATKKKAPTKKKATKKKKAATNTRLTPAQRKVLEDLRAKRSSLTWKRAHRNTKMALVKRKLVVTDSFSGNIEPTDLALRLLDKSQ